MLKGVASVSVKDLDAGFADQLKANKMEVDQFLNKVALYLKNEAQKTSAFVDRTGNLRKSIRKKKSKFEDGGYIVAASGKNTTKSQKEAGEHSKGWHAHLIEFGHVKILWGKPTGERVPPSPFMRPACQKAGKYAATLIKG